VPDLTSERSACPACIRCRRGRRCTGPGARRPVKAQEQEHKRVYKPVASAGVERLGSRSGTGPDAAIRSSPSAWPGVAELPVRPSVRIL
jgi:hypothetical protein